MLDECPRLHHKINEALIVSPTVSNLDGHLVTSRHLDTFCGGSQFVQGLIHQVHLWDISNQGITTIEALLCLIVMECHWHSLVFRHLEGCR